MACRILVPWPEIEHHAHCTKSQLEHQVSITGPSGKFQESLLRETLNSAVLSVYRTQSSPHGSSMKDYQWLSFNMQTHWTLEGERWARPGRRGAGERGRPWGNPKQGGLRWAGNGIKLQSVLCSKQPWTSLLPSLSLNVLICKNHQLLSLPWKPHVVKDMITP